MNNIIQKVKDFEFKITVRDMAIYAVYFAIFIVMALIPQVGFIKVGPIDTTLMAVPVAIIAVHKGVPGLLFGLFMFWFSSIFAMLVNPSPLFLIMGWGGFFFSMALGRMLIAIPVIPFMLLSKNMNVYLRSLFLGLLISVSNTFIVLGLLAAYPGTGVTGDTYWTIFVLVSINLWIEWIVPPALAFMTAGMASYLGKRDKSEKANRY